MGSLKLRQTKSIRRLRLPGAALGAGGGVTPGPSALTFPAQGARYDLDFASQQYFGGIQPRDGATDDGRFFRPMVAQSTPMLTEEADGSLYYVNTSSLRITSKGLVVHPGVSFTEVLYNRQFGNAAWTKVGCTVAQTINGRDKRTNSASRVTVTAADATILQAYPNGGTVRPFVELNAVSGSGVAQFTTDGGVTREPLSLSDVRFNGWALCTLPMRTIAPGALVGLIFPNSGDVFGVDLMHFSSLDYETSPVTTTTARARKPYDRPSTGTAGSGIGGTMSGLMEFISTNNLWGIYLNFSLRIPDRNIFGFVVDMKPDRTVSWGTQSGTQIVTPNAALEFPAMNKVIGIANGDGSGRICLNGGPVISGPTGFGAYTDLDHKDLMSNGAGTANGDGVIKRLSIFQQSMTDAQMQAWTAL